MKDWMVLFGVGVATSLWAGTETVPLNDGWKFALDGAPAREISVPHDWAIEAAPVEHGATGKEWGFYPGGNGSYTLDFELTAADLKKRLELVFDGVLGETTVRVNDGGTIPGSRYGYTGFRVPLEGNAAVKVGKNRVVVTVRNDQLPASRWYRGSGIVRGVHLEKHSGQYVAPATLRVSTVSIAETSAKVRFQATVIEPDGTRKEVQEEREIASPHLWTPEDPYLYTLEFQGEKVRVGIRTVAVDAQKGFQLNGRTLKLHGACVHHDHGPLGAASYPAAEYRKALQLKRAGFNAVRTSHNPVDEAFLTACDEVGLLVMSDMFDAREKPKTQGDYANCFAEDWRKDVEWIVTRDRLHPSVVMWSVGNEILERSEKRAAATTRAMHELIDQLDGTRPVTQALCLWGGEKWTDQDEMAAALDVVGYNYLEHFTESDHARLPSRVIVYTETFPKDAAMVWRRIQANPYVIGEFVWTGIDYLGESGIGRVFDVEHEKWGEHYHSIPEFPWHGAYCGDIDLAGTRKPISHYRETLWNPSAPTYLAVREPDTWRRKIATTYWGVWPTYDHWTFPGWEGKEIVAEVYSRAAVVRLQLNGREVARQSNSAANAWKTEFTLYYAPGELVAEGLSATGEVIDRSVLRTAGAPDQVRYTTEQIGSLEWVTAEVVDAQGTVVPYADREVTFEGNVLATCSGDLGDNVPATSHQRKTWLGRALAIRKRCDQSK